MKIIINKRSAHILALMCFIGFQPRPVKAYSKDFMAPVIAYLVENKSFAAVIAMLSLCMGGFIWHKIDVKRKANRVEELLGLDKVRLSGAFGVHGSELALRYEKMGRILFLAEGEPCFISSNGDKQEVLDLFTIPAVRQECFTRQELSLEAELERSEIWKRNIYANCGQKLMGQKETQFKNSSLIGTEFDISDKEKIKDQLTWDQRRYAGLKTFSVDLIGKDNLSVWLKNTTHLKTSLQQISNELALESKK